MDEKLGELLASVEKVVEEPEGEQGEAFSTEAAAEEETSEPFSKA